MEIIMVSIKLIQSSVLEKKILPQCLFNSLLIIVIGEYIDRFSQKGISSIYTKTSEMKLNDIKKNAFMTTSQSNHEGSYLFADLEF
jgi:hypothetical protein